MDRDSTYLLGNDFAKGNKSNKTSFKEGHKPWNKGKKEIHLSPATEFKKGCKSIRTKPVGTISIRHRKSRNESPRAWIKIAEPSIWTLRAVYEWEKYNGKIEQGLVVHHKDRNPLNDEIINLEIMSRSEHLAEHRNEHKRQGER